MPRIDVLPSQVRSPQNPLRRREVDRRCDGARDTSDVGSSTWVVLFRGQHLTDADLIAFGRRFGQFQYSNPLPSPLANEGKVRQGGRQDAHPEITVVSNVVETVLPSEDSATASSCGTATCRARSAAESDDALCDRVPASGGRTGFNNMYAAHDHVAGCIARTRRALAGSSTTLRSMLRVTFERTSRTRQTWTSARAREPYIRSSARTRRPAQLSVPRAAREIVFDRVSVETSETLLERMGHTRHDRSSHGSTNGSRESAQVDNRCVMHRRSRSIRMRGGVCIAS